MAGCCVRATRLWRLRHLQRFTGMHARRKRRLVEHGCCVRALGKRKDRQSFLTTMLGNLLVMSFAFSAILMAILRAMSL